MSVFDFVLFSDGIGVNTKSVSPAVVSANYMKMSGLSEKALYIKAKNITTKYMVNNPILNDRGFFLISE